MTRKQDNSPPKAKGKLVMMDTEWEMEPPRDTARNIRGLLKKKSDFLYQ